MKTGCKRLFPKIVDILQFSFPNIHETKLTQLIIYIFRIISVFHSLPDCFVWYSYWFFKWWHCFPVKTLEPHNLKIYLSFIYFNFFHNSKLYINVHSNNSQSFLSIMYFFLIDLCLWNSLWHFMHTLNIFLLLCKFLCFGFSDLKTIWWFSRLKLSDVQQCSQ